MKSREQLVTSALEELGAVGAGQTASAEDYKFVDDYVVPVLSDLSTRNVYSFGDPDQIEDETFVHLVTLLANARGRRFGVPPSDAIRIPAENRLRDLRAQTLSGQPVQVDYF